MGTQKNHLNETVLLSTQNICLKLWVRKYFQFYGDFFFLNQYLRLFACWAFFHALVVVCSLFSKLTFSRNSFRNAIRVSNSLNPEHEDVLIWVQTVCKDYQPMTSRHLTLTVTEPTQKTAENVVYLKPSVAMFLSTD